jgi:hypothetical protein
MRSKGATRDAVSPATHEAEATEIQERSDRDAVGQPSRQGEEVIARSAVGRSDGKSFEPPWLDMDRKSQEATAVAKEAVMPFAIKGKTEKR